MFSFMFHFTLCSLDKKLEPFEFSRRKIIAISTSDEDLILEMFKKKEILPSSEVFFLKNEANGIEVKQSIKL